MKQIVERTGPGICQIELNSSNYDELRIRLVTSNIHDS